MLAITDVLLKLKLSLVNCRRQCYNGASDIMGHKTGVVKISQGPPTKGLSYSLSWTLTQLLIISEVVIHLKPLALAYNTLLNLHNSSYHTQPHPIIIIANFTMLSSRQLK